MKVLVVDQNPDDACSWYRCSGPWTALSRGGIHVEFDLAPDWYKVRQFDWLFVSRPHKESDIAAIKAAKWHGVKVWVDFDDDLLNLPPENPARLVFSRPQPTLVIRRSVDLADLVSVSTDKLFEVFTKVIGNSEKIRVIPNALDPGFLASRQLTKPGKGKVVLWRGSSTHQADLQYYKYEILSAASKFPETLWMFMGSEPWFANEFPAGKCRVMPPLTLQKYFDLLASLHGDIGIVPLQKSQFNSCKSTIAAMELSFAGAACVVPKEWELPGTYGYDSLEDFGESLRFALEADGERLAEQADKTITHYKQQYSLGITNVQRSRILNGFA